MFDNEMEWILAAHMSGFLVLILSKGLLTPVASSVMGEKTSSSSSWELSGKGSEDSCCCSSELENGLLIGGWKGLGRVDVQEYKCHHIKSIF